MTDISRLGGKTAVITGAASGIGAATARLLAAQGAAVAVTDVSTGDGQLVAAECGNGSIFIPLDVTSPEAWAVVVEKTISTCGGIDILVNNAGGSFGRGGTLEETSLADYEFIVGLNLTGPWLGMQAVIDPMRARGGGSIINISSIAGMVGFPNMAAYTAAKWAVRGLTKVAANELAPDNIRVNSIHPGFTATAGSSRHNMAQEIADTGGHLGARVPLGRVGRPEDLASAVLFLASDESSYVTGAELQVDGGVLISPMDMTREGS